MKSCPLYRACTWIMILQSHTEFCYNIIRNREPSLKRRPRCRQQERRREEWPPKGRVEMVASYEGYVECELRPLCWWFLALLHLVCRSSQGWVSGTLNQLLEYYICLRFLHLHMIREPRLRLEALPSFPFVQMCVPGVTSIGRVVEMQLVQV